MDFQFFEGNWLILHDDFITHIFLICRNFEMKSFYLLCFLLAVILAACTSSPLVDFDEDNYDSELNDQVSEQIYKIICMENFRIVISQQYAAIIQVLYQEESTKNSC